MRTWIHIDRKALEQNLELFFELAKGRDLMPVLKSNAYGHGLESCIEAILNFKQVPEWLGFNYVHEGLKARKLGYPGHILIVGPTPSHEYETAHKQKLDLVIYDHPGLEFWLAMKDRPRAHLKVDTGMGRLGFYPSELEKIVPKLEPAKKDLYALSSHFSNVEDVLTQSYAEYQAARLAEAVRLFESHGFELSNHIASSASSMILDHKLGDIVRVGIGIYGAWPSRSTQVSYLQHHQARLRPVLSWHTEIVLSKAVAAGEYIGYGCAFKATQNLEVSVLPVGYFEGYPRILGTARAYVLLAGQRCPIVGRICMNMMMIETTHVSPKDMNGPVTLLGQQGDETISAALLGEWAQTINYEILTRINPDIPRILV